MKVTFLLVTILSLYSNSYAQITRGDTTRKSIALVFTGDEFADGGSYIIRVLRKNNIKSSFFLTGNFYRNPAFRHIVTGLAEDDHYLGSHSDKHLLYCDWNKRDSLLVTKQEFVCDLERSYQELAKWGVKKDEAVYFLPPYEWYNDSIVAWTRERGLKLVNYTAGTRSSADYTYPEMGSPYVSSKAIFESILKFESESPSGLNGFILLVHIGTDPRRIDKFYYLLPELISALKKKGYKWMRIDEMLHPDKLK